MAQSSSPDFDVLVIGAGFSGLYLLHRLRQLGLTAHAFEAGSTVGGTWYWNRYPGARVDVQSLEYSFSFDEALEQEWQWSERYAPQAELLAYAEHIADRFDLRRDIQFNTRITSAHWNDTISLWTLTTDTGTTRTARHCILATGSLSVPTDVTFPGIDTYEGQVHRTSRWPHQGVDFTGQRVGIIGTGSSAIQSIPEIAKQAAHLTVFQRTPNYSMPAHNGPIPEDDLATWRADPRAYRAASKATIGGFQNDAREQVLATESTPEDIEAELERRWAWGGFRLLSAFADQVIDARANAVVADFVASKIRAQVTDPAIAEKLIPHDHPFATKRPCVDTGYYATFNRPNVTLVDLRSTPITSFTTQGIATTAAEHPLDAVVLATGFDAMTGAIDRIDIRGRHDVTMKQSWAEGPQTYLGLMVADFPNLFIITGPGSPSVLTNMINSIEQHVEWVTDCIAHLASHQQTSIEATPDAQTAWTELVQFAVKPTLYQQANSWYMGANVPGKPRTFMPYAGGLNTYTDICNQVRDKGYEGFTIRQGSTPLAPAQPFTSYPPLPDLPAPLIKLVMQRLGIAAE